VVLMEEQKQNRSEERLINEDQEPMEDARGVVPLDEQDHENKDDVEEHEHDEDEREREDQQRRKIDQTLPPWPRCSWQTDDPYSRFGRRDFYGHHREEFIQDRRLNTGSTLGFPAEG